MLLVTVNNQKNVMNNSGSDDVLRFFPKQFSALPSQIKVELVPEEVYQYLNNVDDARLDFEMTGYVRKAKVITQAQIGQDEQGNMILVAPEQVQIIGEPIKLLTLKQWPYDENGNFLGNQFE